MKHTFTSGLQAHDCTLACQPIGYTLALCFLSSAVVRCHSGSTGPPLPSASTLVTHIIILVPQQTSWPLAVLQPSPHSAQPGSSFPSAPPWSSLPLVSPRFPLGHPSQWCPLRLLGLQLRHRSLSASVCCPPGSGQETHQGSTLSPPSVSTAMVFPSTDCLLSLACPSSSSKTPSLLSLLDC